MADYPKWLTLAPDVGQVLVLSADEEAQAKKEYETNARNGKKLAAKDDGVISLDSAK